MKLFRNRVLYLMNNLEHLSSWSHITQSEIRQSLQQSTWIYNPIRSYGTQTGEKLTTQNTCSSDLSHNALEMSSNTPDTEAPSSDPGLSVYVNEDSPDSLSSCSRDVIPGKGMPPEPPVDCCMSGCANCVWIMYADEVKKYYEKDGNDRAKREIDKIENPSLKMFLKLELGLL
jgi:hypothetical protein